MSRVWKRTFYKIGNLILIVASIIGYILGFAYIGHLLFHSMEFGLIAGMIFYFMLMVGFTAYKDAKREIERENEDLMKQLTGEP